MYIPSGQTDELTLATATKLARQCRHIIQGVLREDEWRDADREFSAVILAGLESYKRQVLSLREERKRQGQMFPTNPGYGQ